MPEVTVIGSGVIGLSAALNLQSAGFDVRVLTRDMPQATASSAAGAVWSGGSVSGRSRRWADDSLSHFLPLTEQTKSGVGLRRMWQVFPHQVSDPWFKDRLPFFAKMPAVDLPPNCRDGWIMDLPIVAPPRYLQNLQDQFLGAGGSLEVREVESPGDLAAKVACSSIARAHGRNMSRRIPKCFLYAGRRSLLMRRKYGMAICVRAMIRISFPVTMAC